MQGHSIGATGAGVFVRSLAVIAAIVWGQAAPAQECEPQWAHGLFIPAGTSSGVSDMTTWDDGRGEALFVGGRFSSVGGEGSPLIARWDGLGWEPLTSITGSGLQGDAVWALTVFDDGRGPAIYAAGQFDRAGGLTATNIAKWDGRVWRPLEGSLGEGVNGRVDALAVYDDGTGPALYVGGWFNRAGGVSAAHIAKWDGREWSRLGSGFEAGLDHNVFALEVFDDGSGEALYAGGAFLTATGAGDTRRLARWDGSQWSAVGSGADGNVSAMRVVREGSQEYLYIGGSFQTIGGVSAPLVVRYDGTDWRALGAGIEGSEVRTILSFDDGQGTDLYVGGDIFDPGSTREDAGIARWDGMEWTSLRGGVQRFVSALIEFEGVLVVGGNFELTSERALVNNIAEWTADGWKSFGQGVRGGVRALATFDEGDGPILFVGGGMESVGGQPAEALARWDGREWDPLNPGVRSAGFATVRALHVFDDGSGEALYVGGQFERVGDDLPAPHIARWTGTQWESLGEGLNGAVNALAVFTDGGGTWLYAGGSFTSSGGTPMPGVARWTGSVWEAVGSGPAPGINGEVNTMAVWDGALYIGGRFTLAGGVAVSNLARWNGSEWSRVGDAGGSGFGGPIEALASFDDATGSALYVSGEFNTVDGVAAANIARWDSSTWRDVDGGLSDGGLSLHVHDNGSGSALYVGGGFGQVGPVDDRIDVFGFARWTGARWEPIDLGVQGQVLAMETTTDAMGPALYVGGAFERVDTRPSAGLGRRSSCIPTCPADFDGDGTLTLFDFLAFQSAFSIGDPTADFDRDGVLTIFDFLAFQSAFAMGCP